LKRTLISAGEDEVIHFWELSTGKELGQLKGGHRGGITCLALLPSGKGLISGSADTSILVWDAIALMRRP
jgi:WD40 repeat protein